MSDDYFHKTIQDVMKDIHGEKERGNNEINRSDRADSLETLAGGIGHDLNNMLSAGTGYPDLYMDDPALPDNVRNALRTIKDGNTRAANLVNKLIRVTHPQKLQTSSINLNSLINRLSNNADYNEIQRNTVVEPNMNSSVPNVSGLYAELSDAVLAVISHAAENVKGSGVVNISTHERNFDKSVVAFETIPSGNYVELRISDTGKEIQAGDLAKLFEPYRSKEIHSLSGSMGLDMAYAYRIVKDCGGYVDTESSEMGNRISFYLPVKDDTPKKEISIVDRIIEYGGNNESVLVVDDQEQVRNITAMMLTKLGYDVLAMESGDEALRYLKGNPVDLLVLDMQMPIMDGAETFRHAKEIRSDQKAIILTGYGYSNQMDKAKAYGIETFVQKPSKLEELGKAVKQELLK